MAVKRALISVSDKTGVVDFARGLHELGVEIISTGGTMKAIADAGIPVKSVSEVTGFPEMMDGRVKTLHPMIHGGILAIRDNPEHVKAMKEHGITGIDLVAVNLYPFRETIAKPDVTRAEAIENIDIGGPSMVRAAAKNYKYVAVVVDPKQYDDILERIKNDQLTDEFRLDLSRKAFLHTGLYDCAIADYLTKQVNGDNDTLPDIYSMAYVKLQDLRYGENPHQQAVFYRVDEFAHEHSLVNAQQLNGKELSYNNILDTDACWSLVRELDEPAVIILKHQNPCGSATAETITEAYDKAFACDPKSAFGGIIAANRQVTLEMVEHINENKQFVEVLIAPEFESAALELLQQKKNLRVLRTGGIDAPAAVEVRSVDGGVLVQDVDHVSEDPATFTVPTDRKPTDAEMHELMFAWRVCKGVKSNAILVSRNHAGIGMGPGQPNRVDSALLACKRAHEACERMGVEPKGLVCASDAFFPFRDNVDTLAEWGITAIIQPGGSVRDEESIQACNEHGIAMVFTGHRHFRH